MSNLRDTKVKYDAYVVGLLLPLLSTTAQTQDKMKGRFLLNVIVTEGATIFKLLAGENQALLVGWNPAHTHV